MNIFLNNVYKQNPNNLFYLNKIYSGTEAIDGVINKHFSIKKKMKFID